MAVTNKHFRGLVLGVDVGGTFTDLVQLDPSSGVVRLAKVASTLDNQAFGVMNAIDKVECKLAEVAMVIHGTTTTTNAVLERKLSKTALITTAGFRDILELGRRTRPKPYGMTGHFEPIIPRDLRFEIPERIDASGRIVRPIDDDAVNAVGQKLLSSGVESVVVHFLHSYVNPEHELRAAALLDKFWPNPYITVGHKLLLESREFERGVTAAVNASVQPLLERYLKRLSEELQGRGYLGELLIMNGNGGTISANRVVEEAVKTVMSGPASGVIAAAYTGRCAKRPNLITYDMGGTSTDVALIYDCQPSVSNEIEIEYAMPIHVPMVDVRTIGAGGGSIARVNQAGLLEVGPESAGADPGPICYGLGGDLPTITDANALLGRLDIEKFGRGKEKVSLDRIREIFQLKIGNPLGVDAETAASAVLRMANTLMAGAIRMVSISLGADPRDFSLFAFGGAGPLHASALASELGIPEVFVPARPGITNALGCVVADLRYDFVRTINTPLDIIETTVLEEMLLKQSFDGNALVEQEPVDIDKIKIEHSLDMQFVGQTHMLTVPMECASMTRKDILSAFEKIYFDRFRIHLPEVRVRIVNVRTIVTGCRPTIDLTGLIDCSGRAHSLSAAQTGSRKVCFYGSENVLSWHDVPIYDREKLPLEFQLSGPAILEQMDTTVLIEPENNVSSDRHGNIFIKVGVLDEA